VRNLQISIASAFKICKQSLQTASAEVAQIPYRGLAPEPQWGASVMQAPGL